ARLAVARPTQFVAHYVLRIRNRDIRAFGVGDDARDGAHEVEPADREGALLLQRLGARRDLAAEIGLGRLGVGGGARQRIEERCHRAFPEAGGRERESTPPRTGSRPLPDLKSGRPTGDDSLPCVSSAGRRNRSRRCRLMRRRSPRRKVTPGRSNISRIWIATCRLLSSRSRSCAAENWFASAWAAMSAAISTI